MSYRPTEAGADPPGEPLLTIESGANVLKACLHGAVSISAAEPLHRGVIELAESGKDIVFDLGAVERLDASAIQLLLAAGQEIGRGGRSCSITGAGPAIAGYLELAAVSFGRPGGEKDA